MRVLQCSACATTAGGTLSSTTTTCSVRTTERLWKCASEAPSKRWRTRLSGSRLTGKWRYVRASSVLPNRVLVLMYFYLFSLLQLFFVGVGTFERVEYSARLENPSPYQCRNLLCPVLSVFSNCLSV